MEQIEMVNSKHCIAAVPAPAELGPMSPLDTLVIGEIDDGPVNNISGRALHTASS